MNPTSPANSVDVHEHIWLIAQAPSVKRIVSLTFSPELLARADEARRREMVKVRRDISRSAFFENLIISGLDHNKRRGERV